MSPNILEIRDVSMRYGGVTALDGVSFDVRKGIRHALLGENGAGKSTLIKIICGEQPPAGGQMRLNGQSYAPQSPGEARRAGIAPVSQELAYCPELSVAENILMGALPSRLGFVRKSAARQEAVRRLERLRIQDAISPDWQMGRLSTGQAQMVQIAAAVAGNPALLLLDEPTSALSAGEASRLAGIVRQLRDEGVSILYVSHRMEEIFGSEESGFPPCDAFTVLRDGKHVETAELAGRTPESVIASMIGRAGAAEFVSQDDEPNSYNPQSNIRLSLRNLTDPRHAKFSGIDLEIRAGEILGMAGLVGSGRTELARAVIGLDSDANGEVKIDGAPYTSRSVTGSLKRNAIYLTEDRKREGLSLDMPCLYNWSLPFTKRFASLGGAWLNLSAERKAGTEAFAGLRVKAASPMLPARSLSGGNQQKILFARWLSACPSPAVAILDEPTRGVDVGAKAEIHAMIRRLARNGTAVWVISSDLPELLSLSDRLAVMRQGQIAGILEKQKIDAHSAGMLMIGV